MLATMVCVLSSASLGSGMGVMLPQEEEFVLKYAQYLTAYAKLLHVWQLDEERLDVLSHLEALKDRRPDVLVPPSKAPSLSTLEDNPVDGLEVNVLTVLLICHPNRPMYHIRSILSCEKYMMGCNLFGGLNTKYLRTFCSASTVKGRRPKTRAPASCSRRFMNRTT